MTVQLINLILMSFQMFRQYSINIAAHRYILVRYHMDKTGDNRMNLLADIHALPCFQFIPFQELFAVLRQSSFFPFSSFLVLLCPNRCLRFFLRLRMFRLVLFLRYLPYIRHLFLSGVGGRRFPTRLK